MDYLSVGGQIWRNLQLIGFKPLCNKLTHKGKIEIDTHSIWNPALFQCFLSLCLPDKHTPEQAATIPQQSQHNAEIFITVEPQPNTTTLKAAVWTSAGHLSYIFLLSSTGRRNSKETKSINHSWA